MYFRVALRTLIPGTLLWDATAMLPPYATLAISIGADAHWKCALKRLHRDAGQPGHHHYILAAGYAIRE
jgi:hypothetical protein